jgi:hypothetical protein
MRVQDLKSEATYAEQDFKKETPPCPLQQPFSMESPRPVPSVVNDNVTLWQHVRNRVKLTEAGD